MRFTPLLAARTVRRVAFCASALVLCASLASAARAQVVQQPEFNFFSTQTTVLVPDRGGMYMGGLGGLSEGSTTRGVPLVGRVPGVNRGFQNRGLGRSVSGGGVSVHATIIDLAEMDRAILEAAGQRRASRDVTAELNQHAGVLAEHVQGDEAPLQSVAEIRRQHEAADAAVQEQALAHYANGQAAEAEGKYGVARTYYRLALRDATGELASEISARLSYVEAARQARSDR